MLSEVNGLWVFCLPLHTCWTCESHVVILHGSAEVSPSGGE